MWIYPSTPRLILSIFNVTAQGSAGGAIGESGANGRRRVRIAGAHPRTCNAGQDGPGGCWGGLTTLYRPARYWYKVPYQLEKKHPVPYQQPQREYAEYPYHRTEIANIINKSLDNKCQNLPTAEPGKSVNSLPHRPPRAFHGADTESARGPKNGGQELRSTYPHGRGLVPSPPALSTNIEDEVPGYAGAESE